MAADAAAQAGPKLLDAGVGLPSAIVYVGDSFFYDNNGLDGHVARLRAADGTAIELRSSSFTFPRAGLSWHDLDSYFRAGKEFDVAVMMDCSQCPLHPTLNEAFRENTRKSADIVRKHGAKPAFFMTWAYANKPEMTAELAEAYTTAGNDNDALVIPAGLAFARALARKRDINLHMPDKRHPTLAGTYLASATTYAALFHRSPVGLKYTAGLDQETATFLQAMARETVQDYFGQTPRTR